MNQMKKILGIDVGGTKIASALVENGLELKDLRVEPTSQIDLVRQLRELIKSQKNFDAIGLAMPGQVLPNGTVIKLPNVANFQPTNLKQLFEQEFKVPVAVVNDAKAFALAEASIGQGQNNKVVAGVILGTGTGVGIVIDKKIYFGKDGLAGELSHVALLDGTLLGRKRHEAGEYKDAVAAKSYLTTLFNMFILSFNPDIIMLGGGWSNIPQMEEVANQITTNVGDYENKTLVRISQLKYPSLIGAALHTLEQ
jgi:predicted NBD/HSP70 family sugar kinase